MAATVTIGEQNGASPGSQTTATNINFGSTDAPNLTPASYPITIPPSGTNYSFEKWLRIHCTGTYGVVDNLQFWHSAGTPSTGVSFYFGTETTYADLDDDLGPADTAVPTSDPGSANIGIDGSLSGSFTSNETADSDYVVLQMRVSDAASPGNMTQITWTFQYDEQ